MESSKSELVRRLGGAVAEGGREGGQLKSQFVHQQVTDQSTGELLLQSMNAGYNCSVAKITVE